MEARRVVITGISKEDAFYLRSKEFVGRIGTFSRLPGGASLPGFEPGWMVIDNIERFFYAVTVKRFYDDLV